MSKKGGPSTKKHYKSKKTHFHWQRVEQNRTKSPVSVAHSRKPIPHSQCGMKRNTPEISDNSSDNENLLQEQINIESSSFKNNMDATDDSDSSDVDCNAHEFNNVEYSNDKSHSNCHNEVFETDNTIMFPEAKLTTGDIQLMITGMVIRFNMTRVQSAALVEFTRTLAGPKFDEWNFSDYTMSKLYGTPTDKITLNFYCTNCYNPPSQEKLKQNFENKEGICNNCKEAYNLTSVNSNYFYSIDIEYQIQLLLNRKTIQSSLLENLSKIKNGTENDFTIRDVYDTILYKQVQRNCSTTLTCNFNTDGAPIFKSSKNSFWPLQFIINELPPSIRFKNVILAAIWLTNKEPSPAIMNCMMSSFVEQVLKLNEKGLLVKHYDTKRTMIFRLIPIAACVKLQLKEWQSKCSEKEKRLQASEEKRKFLTKKNQELQEMLTKTTKLNMDLQRHVINFF